MYFQWNQSLNYVLIIIVYYVSTYVYYDYLVVGRKITYGLTSTYHYY